MSINEIPRDPIPDQLHFEEFGCAVPGASPPTPDRVEPDVSFFRRVRRRNDPRQGRSDSAILMPDGQTVTVWVFTNDESDVPPFPSDIIRVREGQVVHTTMSPSHGTHTIHHHGIEPTPMNDGVGHTSFEVDGGVLPGEYSYQWYASTAGTYHYHCHKNTILHFEIGMYGSLIIDPPTGQGTVYRRNEIIPYDVEAIWVTDDFDNRLHIQAEEEGHSVGLVCPFDPVDWGQNRFDPEYFIVSGVPAPLTETHSGIVRNVQTGQRLLIRFTNAAYGLTSIRLNGLRSEIIANDGRTLGRAPKDAYSEPIPLAAGEPWELSTASRVDMLVEPRRPGDFRVDFEFEKAWVGRGEVVTASTWIHVTGDPIIDFFEIAGATAIATAVEISQAMFPDGADAVVIATIDNWPDALTAPELTRVLGAPLLLTETESLSSAVESEIGRLGATRAVILGGPRAVSPRATIRLNQILGGHNVSRIFGQTRYETAAEVARRVVELTAETDTPWDGTVVIASGEDFADALTIGALANAAGWPVLLTRPGALHPSTEAVITELGAQRAIIVGGPVAVSAVVRTRLDGLLGPENVRRLDGATRYDTAREVARFAVAEGHLNWRRPGVAGGTSFPEAIVGAIMQGHLGSPLLITPPDSLHPATASALQEALDIAMEELTFYGSVQTLSADVRNEIRALLRQE